MTTIDFPIGYYLVCCMRDLQVVIHNLGMGAAIQIIMLVNPEDVQEQA